jgi:pyrroline-5-carboxylate reductase
MGEALIAGLLASGWTDADHVTVVEALPARREQLAAQYPGLGVVATAERPGAAVVVAVKPNDVGPLCADLARRGGVRQLLSVAAGVRIATIEALVGGGVAVVRAMPNTPALVGAGVSAIAGGSAAGPDDLAWARGILAAVGAVVEVGEYQLDAVTGLSGSGPAYVFLVAEAMVEAGVLAGLPRPVAETLALGTIAGAGRMLVESGRSPAELRADVTSPGGTTAAGLAALEDRAVRAAFLAAVTAAAKRSAELGA